LGKEIYVFVDRLRNQIEQLKSIPFSAKFGGATGNFNAHHVAYPDIDWIAFADHFVNNVLGLDRSRVTTQIDHYDNLAAFFDGLKRINTILIDLNRDMWSYISMDYFKQKIKDDEVGSSTMPHKINPIDFENSEGNLGLANAIFEHLSAKLPISRLQRDLTDSTAIRNIGVPIAHSLIAWKSLLRGLDKLILNEEVIRSDLQNNWAVIAEAIQTILRREGYPEPYEALKALARTHSKIDQKAIADFIEDLDVRESIRKELMEITPENYTGIYSFLGGEKKPAERIIINGQPVSSGIAEGRATVVRGLENFKAVNGRTILVCPCLSPDLVTIFPSLSGLVTETGGILVPAAAIAREYGIPTVVGTFRATEVINDGDIIRVDGTKGCVEIISKAQ
ncbi:MAG: hypothetical protein KKE57_09000, partial [Proteobacteria bacterium]|nr:hypothetical protein [Pseudomonadota bacterium]